MCARLLDAEQVLPVEGTRTLGGYRLFKPEALDALVLEKMRGTITEIIDLRNMKAEL
jgi:hypothetical protein